MDGVVRDVIGDGPKERWRLLDILRGVQARLGCVPPDAVRQIASEIGVEPVEIESLVAYYAFLSSEKQGRMVIRLCDDILDRFAGYEEVKNAFEEELGIKLGETTPDGAITLEHTPCIGMCDQAPAAMVDEVIVTKLSSDEARRIVKELREHADPERLVKRLGDGNNGHPLVHAMVENNVRLRGDVLFSPVNRGEAIRKALSISPMEVIRSVKASRLRGRGGAGFPTGLKWELARQAERADKIVMCNADEGEPGTFKDRVLLTEMPDRVFAGMTIEAYASGASEGILYLRGEYAYLKPFLESVLDARRADHLLGDDILGKGKFSFDIRIQLGAGAYMCGEETAMIASCEGLPGEAKTRPPFPVQHGYFGRPTVVNNVETLACVTKILEEGAATFCMHGTDRSAGTKLLSIAGDCSRPGVYEIPFGITLGEVMELCGGTEANAVQVGGPSGTLVGRKGLTRTICYDDLATGGAIMVFGPDRDITEIVHNFLEFFEDESCGHCAPCRVGTVLMRRTYEDLRAGRIDRADLDELRSLCETIKSTSRCGLGQTAPNPILTSLTAFGSVYDSKISEGEPGRRRSFDLGESVRESERLVGRASEYV